MNYFIIAEEYRIGVLGIGGIPKMSTDYFPIGDSRESKFDPVIPHKFATRESAQRYIDEQKPEGKTWEIFLVENDDYANF